MKSINKLLVVVALSFFFILSGCGGMNTMGENTGEESSGTTQNTEVESFGTNDQYFYVPINIDLLDWEAYPAMASFAQMAMGYIKIFDPALHFPINWEDEENLPPLVSYEEVEEYMAENDHPNSYDCALPTVPLPERDASWAGSESGGCGTWATAVCNRILGITDSDSEVTKDEWNDIAGDIGQNDSGGSKMSDQSKYYEDLGYCVNDKKFGGSEADYTEMSEQIDNNCDVKLYFWKRNADGTYTNGHVETVTGADADNQTATTNSWGNQGTVSGGDRGGFDHSLDGTQFQDSTGNELWPADGTEVWVSYVCECGFFEGLAKALGF